MASEAFHARTAARVAHLLREAARRKERVIALAISTGEPLLFKGDDFVHTDVTMVDLGSR